MMKCFCQKIVNLKIHTSYDMDCDIVADAERWPAGVASTVLHPGPLYKQTTLQHLNDQYE